jgi:hypothetical protein
LTKFAPTRTRSDDGHRDGKLTWEGTATNMTADELKQASRHVFYEIEMLIDTANALQFRTGLERVLTNALLESFGLHARSLLEFATATGTIKDTVYAREFFAPGTWNSPQVPSTLAQIAEDANKHLAHITRTRLGFEPPQEKQWLVGPIADALLRLLEKAFYQLVDKTLLHDEWSNGLPKLQGVTQNLNATGTAAQVAAAATK